MKSTVMMSISITSLLATFAIPIRVAAQEPTATQTPAPIRYTVTDLGTLEGGVFSQPFYMSKNGVVSGSSALANNSQNAVLWYNHQIANLGTLGGPNSIAFDARGRNHAIGEAETSTSDPNGEDFCGFGTHLICSPFSWEHGVMTPLPTLGGNNGLANQINESGVVAGLAENTTSDPACPSPQVYQFKPVVWVKGEVKELPTIAGDPEGVAISTNDLGHVVGTSGTCATFNANTLFNLLPVHAILWRNGKAIDLGNLGGGSGTGGGNIAWGINTYGHVIGVSDLKHDKVFHAFLWTEERGMRDLGTLPGDKYSSASSINDEGEIVGVSLDKNFNARAFLRKNGVMTDLNTLVPPGSISLLTACAINSRGEIAGLGMTSTGEFHAYMAKPVQH
jgi:probable HAF family extracellular repeat protein